MAHRIRKARVTSTHNGQESPVFIYDETDTQYEVLLATEEEFQILFFDKITMMSYNSSHLLYVPQEDM